MTTATHESKTRSAGAANIARLRPNPWNKARPLDDAFTESVRVQGVLSSLLIREVEDDGTGRDLEIICGERRWRAAELVGREYVPAITVELDDENARIATLTENTHRAGLSPWQEAQLVGELLALDGMDISAAAAATGWSEATVRRRAKLLELSPNWKAMLEAGELPAWTAAHFEVLAVFDEKSQEALHKEMKYRANSMTVAELKEEIANNSKALKSAPWDLDDVTLVPRAGACTACEKRSDCQADLFGGVKGIVKAGSSCLDEVCFGKKLAAYSKRKEDALLEKHPEAVKVHDGWSSKKGSIRIHDVTEAKKGDKGAVPAIVHGEGGKVALKYVKVKKEAKEPTEKDKAKEAEKEHAKRVEALAIEKLLACVQDPESEFTDEALPLLTQFVLVVGGGIEIEADDEEAEKVKRVRAYAKKPVTVAELWAAAADSMERILRRAKNTLEYSYDRREDNEAEVELVAWMVDADLAALRAEAEQELDREPTSIPSDDPSGGTDMDLDDEDLPEE